MSYARINWKSIQEENGASLTDLLDKPLKRHKMNPWAWSPSRKRHSVRFIPNTATTVKPEKVYTNKNTTGVKDRNACTVNALAIAGRIPWFMASKLLQRAGRKSEKGFNLDKAIQKHIILGFTFRKLPKREKVTLGQFLARHPVGRFLVSTSDHFFAVVQGKVWDWKTKIGQRSVIDTAYIVRTDRREA